ncbi:MAG: hypothetical protein Q8O84_01805 [Nanoarchaeota archaeon]|nr:hypothetical protein [Nanoarchaeota archaeon]
MTEQKIGNFLSVRPSMVKLEKKNKMKNKFFKYKNSYPKEGHKGEFSYDAIKWRSNFQEENS